MNVSLFVTFVTVSLPSKPSQPIGHAHDSVTFRLSSAGAQWKRFDTSPTAPPGDAKDQADEHVCVVTGGGVIGRGIALALSPCSYNTAAVIRISRLPAAGRRFPPIRP